MCKKSGFRIQDEQPESYFRELGNHFLRLKYLNSLMRIRDGKTSDPRSGIRNGKIRIRDKHSGSTTLLRTPREYNVNLYQLRLKNARNFHLKNPLKKNSHVLVSD
jgi:hypothetical protein